MSIVEVIAGNGNKMYCWSDKGDVTCEQNITTIINIISEANGGNVTCSNNASAGSPANWVCSQAPGQNPGNQPGDKPGHPGDKPAQHRDRADHKPAAAPAAAPVKKAASPVAHRAAANTTTVSTTAQPTGELAYTGAETTAPLALGLIALGAGGALTLAGRRRSSTATV